MPTWGELQDQLAQYGPDERGKFISDQISATTERVLEISQRNVLYYASGFLQKPQVPTIYTSINSEDINGFMAGISGHEFERDLLLVLHTPGGLAETAQTIVDYLRSKYNSIDVLVPTYAMSAGTMIALGCDRIIMGRQSQLGPTDPQLIVGDRQFSAHSIVEQFEEAKKDIAENPVLAHAWAPVLRSFGPALLQEARKSISYGRSLVTEWLREYMFSDHANPHTLAENAATFFSSDEHGSHGRRINRDDAREYELNVVDLEENQELQDGILTLYHLSTIAFENGPAVKTVISSNGKMWVKNVGA